MNFKRIFNIKSAILILLSGMFITITSCGNFDENVELNLDENSKLFMLPMEQVDEIEPNIQPLTKCWAEAGDSCCYANHGKCSTMMGRATCSEVASDGTVTPGQEASGDGCAALAQEYANME